MIYQKENPIGLDILIQRMQNRLTELNATWGLPDGKLDAYGRCYLIDEDSEKTVRYYKGKREYEIISVAEGNKFFFLQKQKAVREKGQTWYQTVIELIFILDLEKLKPEIVHRADFEVQADVEQIVDQFENVWIESIDSGYKDCLSGVKYIQADDMQPYHVFKFTLGVKYDISDTNCCC